MVRAGMIEKMFPYPGARPVFSVTQIDKLYAVSSDNQSGVQSALQGKLFNVFR
jgi:hypothetical protein